MIVIGVGDLCCNAARGVIYLESGLVLDLVADHVHEDAVKAAQDLHGELGLYHIGTN